MTSIAIAVAIMTQEPPLEKTAGAVITKMFQRYFDAKTLNGTIRSVTSDSKGSVEFTTTVAYERPSKIYVSQNRKSRNGLNLLLVSDGVQFSYDPPRESVVKPKPFERLFEPVTTSKFGEKGVEHWSHRIGNILAVGHASLELCRSLDLVVAHEPSLIEFRDRLATFKLGPMTDFNGQSAYTVIGDWRFAKDAPVTGKYSLVVSRGFDLLRFTLVEKYQFEKQVVEVTVDEFCDVQVNGPPRTDLFVVR